MCSLLRSFCSFVCSFVRPFVRPAVCSFVRLFVCSFVRLLIRPLVRSSVCPFFFVLFFHFLSLDINADIVRHSRKEVVNDIEKHSKEVPQVIKMVARRGPGPPFWVPGGAGPPFWASLDPMWPHSGPRSTFGGFWRILEVI